MNVLLLVVDSLRWGCDEGSSFRPATPFFDGFRRDALEFRRAYSAECWTLPSHTSMFTGLLPSGHGAHFQSMAYRGDSPTVAEILAGEGVHTEVVSRNFLFDGSIPGLTRGFCANTRPLAEVERVSPLALVLALSRPRSRRLLRSTGFFQAHRAKRDFLATYSRGLLPADELVLGHTLARIDALRRQGKSFFIFCNLYDVHWPYPPQRHSVLSAISSVDDLVDNLLFPWVLPAIGAHAYLRPGFRLGERSKQMLRSRYRAAVELMDAKLAHFYREASASGLLEDTLLILTSDHGEAFGEHELYLHDASVYDTHLHVPLWIRHPEIGGGVIEDVVTTRDLFSVIRAAGLGESHESTLLSEEYREANPIALAEHFHYAGVQDALPKYRQNLVAAITRDAKLVGRREGLTVFQPDSDPREERGVPVDAERARTFFGLSGAARSGQEEALSHVMGWDYGSLSGPAA